MRSLRRGREAVERGRRAWWRPDTTESVGSSKMHLRGPVREQQKLTLWTWGCGVHDLCGGAHRRPDSSCAGVRSEWGRHRGDLAGTLDWEAQAFTSSIESVLRCLSKQNTSQMARPQRDTSPKIRLDMACSWSPLGPLPLCAWFSFSCAAPAGRCLAASGTVHLACLISTWPHEATCWDSGARGGLAPVPVHSPAFSLMTLWSEFSPPRVALFPLGFTLGSFPAPAPVSSVHVAWSWPDSSKHQACSVAGCVGSPLGAQNQPGDVLNARRLGLLWFRSWAPGHLARGLALCSVVCPHRCSGGWWDLSSLQTGAVVN